MRFGRRSHRKRMRRVRAAICIPGKGAGRRRHGRAGSAVPPGRRKRSGPAARSVPSALLRLLSRRHPDRGCDTYPLRRSAAEVGGRVPASANQWRHGGDRPNNRLRIPITARKTTACRHDMPVSRPAPVLASVRPPAGAQAHIFLARLKRNYTNRRQKRQRARGIGR